MGIENKEKLGFLGPRGTFSEEAALQYNKLHNRDLCECSNISEIMECVAGGRLAEGIVPLENSLEGGVTATMDHLASDLEIMIRSEFLFPISHCLMALPDTQPAEIKKIYSHPHALGQCRSYLESSYNKAVLNPVESTAAAAKTVSGMKSAAAVAASRAASLFKLEILAEDIQDQKENITRFVVVARQDHPPTGADKTSLVLAAPDGPGSLYRVLGHFAGKEVNLTRIESRPARRNLGDWLFFIDCEGHRLDSRLISLWHDLEATVPFLKLIGSYPSISAADQ